MVKTSDLKGVKGWAIMSIATLFSLIYLYFNSVGIASTEMHRGLYFLFTVILAIMIYPLGKGEKHFAYIFIDSAMILAAIFAVSWWVFEYQSYAQRVGDPETMDIVVGAIAILLSIELGRRVIGLAMPVLALIFLGYCYYGYYAPHVIAIKGFSLSKIIEFTAVTMEGLYGGVLAAFASYLIPFTIFGGFLEVSGAGDFFLDIAKSMTGKWVGGPAKIAVISSGFFGSISGSSVANVVGTGTFTIPMMKRVGYPPHFAGAVEAAASTGGQFMPPIMGAGAFIIAELTDTPYWKIAGMAVIPALLYYLSVGVMVHLRAKKIGLRGLPPEEVPRLRDTIRQGGIFFIPLIVIIYLLMRGYSPGLAAFWATMSIVVIGLIRKKREKRMKPMDYVHALAEGGLSNVVVGAAAPVLGLIMGGIILSGLANRFSSIVVDLSGGSLFLTILYICIAAAIVGTSATTTATYLIVALLAIPALTTHFGVPRVVAHLVCFWAANFSGLTPPVCVVAYTAAAIANADLYKTAWESMKLSLFMFVSPFAFVYFPHTLGIGDWNTIVYQTISYAIGIFFFCGAIEGYLVDRCSVVERLALATACILLFVPGVWTDIVGLLMGLSIFSIQKVRLKTASERLASV
jgi:TRAP transporter 4TM/12TM fusion protein